jgi:hypothetical protein
MNTRSAFSSDMRATDARVSVRAAAERRKCWAISRVSASKVADMI